MKMDAGRNTQGPANGNADPPEPAQSGRCRGQPMSQTTYFSLSIKAMTLPLDAQGNLCAKLDCPWCYKLGPTVWTSSAMAVTYSSAGNASVCCGLVSSPVNPATSQLMAKGATRPKTVGDCIICLQ